MKSRITRATITVVSFAGLVLVGVLLCSLRAERANAQRVDYAPFTRPVSPRGPAVNSPPVVKARHRFGAQPTAESPLNDEPPRFTPYGTTSAVLTQPIVIAVKDGPELHGVPVDLDALQVKAIFGPVSIPVDRIAGVRTADDASQPATICLSNGDSLTATLATDSITIKTEWGSATISRDHIVSIVTTAEPVTWQEHEGRWRIIPVEPVTNPAEPDGIKDEGGEVDTAAQPPQPTDAPAAAPLPSPTKPTPASEPSLN